MKATCMTQAEVNEFGDTKSPRGLDSTQDMSHLNVHPCWVYSNIQTQIVLQISKKIQDGGITSTIRNVQRQKSYSFATRSLL